MLEVLTKKLIYIWLGDQAEKASLGGIDLLIILCGYDITLAYMVIEAALEESKQSVLSPDQVKRLVNDPCKKVNCYCIAAVLGSNHERFTDRAIDLLSTLCKKDYRMLQRIIRILQINCPTPETIGWRDIMRCKQIIKQKRQRTKKLNIRIT